MSSEHLVKEHHEDVINTTSSEYSSPQPKRNRNIQSSASESHIWEAAQVIWNHFGRQMTIFFTGHDLNSQNLFAVLMQKIRVDVPEFKGSLGYIDLSGREIIISSDKILRGALDENNGRLKVHTTLAGIENNHLSAAEMFGKPYSRSRSNSMPLQSETIYKKSYVNVEGQVDDGSKLSSASAMRRKPEYQYLSPSWICFPRYAIYQGNPYSQTVLYGMPPNILANPLFPTWPPIGFRQSWIGPNKYIYHGGLFPIDGGHYAKRKWNKEW